MAAQKMRRMRLYAPSRDAVRACVGKTKWATQDAAQRAVSRIRSENPSEMSSTVRPYRCSTCKRWHVGHGQ